MGLRFRKRVKIFPGVWLNLTQKGISSVSIGKPGTTVNINENGVKGTLNIPGTGISYQTSRVRKSQKNS